MIRLRSLVTSATLSAVLLLVGVSAMAQDGGSVTVRDVTLEYKSHPQIFPTPAPNKPVPGGTIPNGDDPIPPLPDPLPSGDIGTGMGTLGNIVAVGSKVWDFIVNNKPTTDYKTLKANVIPEGLGWTQLLWKRDKMLTKVYRVEFKNVFGKPAGSFDYRISFIYGGSFQGKGKFIGQIAVAPANVKLKTDRSLTFRAELLDPLNFGTEEDPVAGAQLLVTWSSPTTTRYVMNSAEYMLFGDGEIQILPNGLH